jgi:hypothetical protein
MENIYPIPSQQSYEARKTLSWSPGSRSIQAVPRHMQGFDLVSQILGRTNRANDTSDTIPIEVFQVIDKTTLCSSPS